MDQLPAHERHVAPLAAIVLAVVAQRLNEFHNEGSASFFAPCSAASVLEKPFQCQAPTRPFVFEDFR
jgi:hypothetical protein